MKIGVQILLLVLCLSPVVMWSQPISDYMPKDMLDAAVSSMERGDYYSALEWYEKTYSKTRDRSLVYTIANINYKLRDYKRSESWFKRVVVTYDQNEDYPDARFKYARSLKMMGEYRAAISEFKEFIATAEDPKLIQLARNEILGAELALESYEVDSELIIENLGRRINTTSSEYSPINGLNTGELYFASMKTSKITGTEDGEDVVFTKIYTSTRSEKRGRVSWSTPKELSPNINLGGTHTSNVILSPDQTELMFTRAILFGNDVESSKLYRSKLSDRGTWGPAEELEGINGDYVVRHPSYGVHLGKEVLFFSADRPGGFGGSDIYYAVKEGDGVYGDPINLGKLINTSANEITPFYFEGTLYYSSDGLPGFGGYDVFVTSWKDTDWDAPLNMSKSYNTSVDEVFFRINPDGESGYLTSNREGTRSLKSKTCCNDIYEFRFEKINLNLIAGTYAQRKPLSGATLQIFEVINGQPINPVELTNNEGFEFQFPLERGKSYKIKALKEGFFPDSTVINTVGVNESQDFLEEFILTVIPPEPEPEPEFIEEIVEINQPIRLNNIYYDFDDDKILEDAEQDLEVLLELLNEYSDMVIELSSHTDARGNDAYNRRLSTRRAESAKKWLVAKGVESDRIKAVGYGESVILNRCANGVKCNDEEHRFNRRTEFKIIEGPTTITIRTKNPARSAIESTNQKRPEITFEEERWAFGNVKKGEQREHEFKFTNTGNADLIIEIVTACNCTTLEYPQSVPVRPGERGSINVIYDSTKEPFGKQEKDITIVANTVPAVSELRYTVRVIR
ncbi:MAG: DUF1573 domain-containing protein [Bacteroidia bacterium]|nr:DUF1573 domain-containing protein [Bacteroidia bacterium]